MAVDLVVPVAAQAVRRRIVDRVPAEADVRSPAAGNGKAILTHPTACRWVAREIKGRARTDRVRKDSIMAASHFSSATTGRGIRKDRGMVRKHQEARYGSTDRTRWRRRWPTGSGGCAG
jgi:hypothetical protein